MNKKEQKEKWLKLYQEEISIHKNQRENEKAKKLQEELEYLNKIKKEFQEEELKRHKIKKTIEKDFVNEYERKINEKKRSKENNSNVENVSLDLKSDERIHDLKIYLNKLTEKVDKNMNDYVEYHKNLRKNSDNQLESTHDKKIIMNNKMNTDKTPNSYENYNKVLINQNEPLQKKLITYSSNPNNRLDQIASRNFLQFKEVI